jgi:hypothetical protein
MKFKLQSKDELGGNDTISNAMGSDAERQWRHFKAFFSIQDPWKKTPDQKKVPNHKVAPLLAHILAVSKSAWDLGLEISVDEQTIGFQEVHIDKLRITYMSEGDGFQCDALCQDGFSYAFTFATSLHPLSILLWGYHPCIHGSWDCLILLIQVSSVDMDSLYNSAKLFRAGFNHPMKVRVAGVTRKGGRGIPACVIQEEKVKKADQLKVRGTVKAAVLLGDPGCPDLVATSVYDTNPVHFLSMTCDSIKWIIKERDVYCVETQ